MAFERKHWLVLGGIALLVVVIWALGAGYVPEIGKFFASEPVWKAPIGVPVPPFGITEGQPSSGPVLTTVPTGTITGPATYKLSGTIGTINFVGNGTPTGYIYVTSADPNNPASVTSLTASGRYVIFDHVKITGGAGFGEGVDHMVIRNSELIGVKGTGSNGSGGGMGVGEWSYAGSGTSSNIVIDHNNIHDVGDVNATTDIDNHCLTVNGAVDHLWVTYNTFTRCGGDSMQLEAQHGNSARINHIYFGKNISSTNRQSGGWVKNASDVIFSQNIAHDMKAGSGGAGPCFGTQYTPQNVWFIFNECYGSPIGIMLAGNDPPGVAGPIYVLGNYIHDIHSADTNPYNSGGITARLGGSSAIVAHNTIVNSDSGVNVLPGQALTLSSNVITGISGPTLLAEGSISPDHNLYAPNAKFSGVTAGASAISADSKFVSATNPHLQATSPAVNAGILNSAYATFQTRYGLNIAVDFDGNARPVGSAWDIGAYEYGGIVVSTPTPSTISTPVYTPTPTPSTNVIVTPSGSGASLYLNGSGASEPVTRGQRVHIPVTLDTGGLKVTALAMQFQVDASAKFTGIAYVPDFPQVLGYENITNQQLTTAVGSGPGGGHVSAALPVASLTIDINPNATIGTKIRVITLNAQIAAEGQANSVLKFGGFAEYVVTAQPSLSPILTEPPHITPTPSKTPVVTTSPAKPGDANSDGKVDIFDYNLVVSNFSKTGASVPGDLNIDSKVDIFDYNLVVSNFGK